MREPFKVLILDDEPQFLKTVARMLRHENYSLLLTESIEESLEFINDNDVAMAIVDQYMPDGVGLDVLKNIKTISPLTTRCIATGRADLTLAAKSINQGLASLFLQKPFKKEQLLDFIKKGMAEYIIKSQSTIKQSDDYAVTETNRSPENLPIQNTSPNISNHANKTDKEPLAILVVDDDINILNAVKRQLRNFDLVIDTVDSGEKAIELLCRKKFAAILCDQKLPGISGVDILREFEKKQPETARILMTGHSSIASILNSFPELHIFRVIMKPWKLQLLRETIQEAVTAYNVSNVTEKNTECISPDKNIFTSMATDSIERILTNTENGLRKIMGLHSPELSSHAIRIADTCRAITRHLQLKKEDVERIIRAAYLHDIGKINIPVTVLAKHPDKHSAKEKKWLTAHPLLGEKIVRQFPELSDTVHLIRHHHESYSGGGFPDGLAAQAIPLGARIISIADFLDRVYYPHGAIKASSKKSAMEALKSECGKLLDESLVSIAIKDLWDDLQPGVKGEIAIHVSEAKPGMLLARDISAIFDTLLLREGAPLTQSIINKLCDFAKTDPTTEIIFIKNNIQSQQSSTKNQNDLPFVKLTILVVDDEKQVLNTLARQLRLANYDVITTKHPEDALILIRKHKVDLMITDYNMPELKGDQLINEIQSKIPDFPCIILTAYATRDNIAKLIKAGSIVRILTKPWSKHDLLQTIRSI